MPGGGPVNSRLAARHGQHGPTIVDDPTNLKEDRHD
jgi:hypothetical protein